MNKTELRQILLSNSPNLLITADGHASAVMEAFPIARQGALYFNQDPPTYIEQTTKKLSSLCKDLKIVAETEAITLTNDYSSDDLPNGSIAYHRIWGMITANSYWYFSSKQFERDLLMADANPAITCHFLHINSAGGEAWYLDRLSETLRLLSKPIMALVECNCCSAGYYIACHATHIAALTANDRIGCIGTMMHTYDYKEYFSKIGIKEIVIKSSMSDLKNKKYEDARDGKPEQLITDELDPLTLQFLSAVKNCRPSLSSLDDQHPAFRGETFITQEAIDINLIDSTMTLVEAVAKAASLGNDYLSNLETRKNALKYL